MKNEDAELFFGCLGVMLIFGFFWGCILRCVWGWGAKKDPYYHHACGGVDCHDGGQGYCADCQRKISERKPP